MVKRESLEGARVDALLRENELQLVPRGLGEPGRAFRADGDPINRGRRAQRAIGLDRDFEALVVQGVDQVGIDLEKRLAARQDHEPLTA